MDDLELIAEALCRLDLPDREVYPAMAHVRDYATPEARQNLLRVFVACVRQGLNLPEEADPWKTLADHPCFQTADSYRDSLQQRAGASALAVGSLFTLLERAVALLNLSSTDLTHRLSQLQSATNEQIERLLMPAFLKASRAKYKYNIQFPAIAWLALHDREELKNEPQIIQLFLFLAGREMGTPRFSKESPLGQVKIVAHHIAGLLGDDPPPNLGGDGDGGVIAPLRPLGPNPGQREKKSRPDAPPE